MSSNFKVTLTDSRGDPDVNRSFEMSKVELKVHFPNEVKLLQNSSCSAVSVIDVHGSGSTTIEKLPTT